MADVAQQNLSALAGEVHKRLKLVFGEPAWRRAHTPLDELISTILSQNTNDRNRDIAFDRLRKRLPNWEAVRDADVGQVVDAIRIAGLANQKGARIQEILRQITAERGNLDLSFLCTLSTDEARSWLLRFKGVGLKTAAIVLLFSLDKPAFPVDTHIYRVSGRVGLRPADMRVEEAHHHLEGLFNPHDYGVVHLNLIRLGREICHARKPDCDHCPLCDICNFAHANMVECNQNPLEEPAKGFSRG
ncbi:MAG: endonuclease III [Anaerolineae bacterium]|nr:endonuclease III [Anaerolineae bacterium]